MSHPVPSNGDSPILDVFPAPSDGRWSLDTDGCADHEVAAHENDGDDVDQERVRYRAAYERTIAALIAFNLKPILASHFARQQDQMKTRRALILENRNWTMAEMIQLYCAQITAITEDRQLAGCLTDTCAEGMLSEHDKLPPRGIPFVGRADLVVVDRIRQALAGKNQDLDVLQWVKNEHLSANGMMIHVAPNPAWSSLKRLHTRSQSIQWSTNPDRIAEFMRRIGMTVRTMGPVLHIDAEQPTGKSRMRRFVTAEIPV
jgi:hypothetical protein